VCTSNCATSLTYTTDTAPSFIRKIDTTTSSIYAATITTELQAATSSRTITPIVYFSETVGSNKSDNNDDRLSWQKVRGRGKKITSPRTTRAPTLKKNKSQETSDNLT
jgi:hypothetical protein